MIDSEATGKSSGLPADVEARIRTEVPERGGRIIDCLRTAAWLLDQTADEVNVGGLRVPESAAYNLREALDALVKGRDHADGGLAAIRTAWDKLQLALPDSDDERDAQADLDCVLATVMAERERSSERARQLLGYLRAKSGAEPLQGPLDPVVQYVDLMGAVNHSLHDACEQSTALDLFDRTVNWFIRMFTTPDAQVRAILQLAAAPYADLGADRSAEGYSRQSSSPAPVLRALARPGVADAAAPRRHGAAASSRRAMARLRHRRRPRTHPPPRK